MSSAAVELDKRRELEERREREGEKHSGISGDLGAVYWGFDETAVLVILVALALLGVFFVLYALVFAFTNVLSLGQVAKARKYYKKVKSYSLSEHHGTRLARKLNQTNIFFALVMLVFAVEEGLRFLLNTGPATFEVWVFRFSCLAVFIFIMAIFLVRLYRWISFKSTDKFQRTQKLIREYDEDPGKWLRAR